MEQGEVGALMQQALWVALRMGGPPLLAALLVGLVMSLVQAVTQINEPTLAFVPKAAAIVAVLLIGGGAMMGALTDFTRSLFDHLVAIGGS